MHPYDFRGPGPLSSLYKREALDVHTELAAVLNQHLGGWADTEASRRGSCRTMRMRRNDMESELGEFERNPERLQLIVATTPTQPVGWR
jgi:hypothetical protein